MAGREDGVAVACLPARDPLPACAWADVYFYEDGLDAEKMKGNDVREP
ncbi:MAG TPA: hypothetical protein VIT62_05970 [Lysobacter sp.]